jgi:hypothetical protein
VDVNYMFMSWGADPGADVASLRSRVLSRMTALDFSPQQVSTWLSRLFFVTDVVATVDAWIPALLANWTSPLEQVQLFTQDAGQGTFPRFDSYYGWLPWPTLDTNYSVVFGGDGCAPALSGDLSSSIAVVTYAGNASSPCDLATIVYAVQNASAAGALIINAPGEPWALINCENNDECNWPLGIPASLVSYEDGQAIVALVNASAGAALINYVEAEVPAFFFGIDELGELPPSLYCG